MDRARDDEADDQTIPDSFFDIASEASGQSDDEDSTSSDDGNASEVENDMLESIFGDVPRTVGVSSASDAATAAADAATTGANDDGKDSDADADASDKSEDEGKVAATPTSNRKGANSAHAQPKSAKARSLTPDVREAGRKARMRLEAERSKRKEIRRIDDDAEGQDLLMQKIPGAAGANAGAHKKSKSRSNKGILLTEPARKKRRRPTKAAALVVDDTTKQDEQNDTIDDLWLPDSSSVNMEGRSNLVRVHGLPYGCKPEEIRRFFKGLNTLKISVLASYRHKIDGWDCVDFEGEQELASDKGKRRRADVVRPKVKRYPSNFRVFVQFESTPAAEQALKRSGETIASHNSSSEIDTDGDESKEMKDNDVGKAKKKTNAAVFISPVAKIHATFLKKRLLAIDGVKGKALHEVVDDVEERLPRFVRRTLWSLAWMKLRPNQAVKPIDDDDDDDDDDECHKVADAFAILERRKCISRPKDANSYRMIAIAYNSLCNLYASIEDQSAVNMALLKHDPTLIEDSACRLTDAALDLISTEAERIDLILRWARETLVGNDTPSS